MFFSGLAFNHRLTFRALLLTFSPVDAHSPLVLFQSSGTRLKSMGLSWNFFFNSSMSLPVSLGKSPTSCSSGSAMTVNPRSSSGLKPRRVVCKVRRRGEETSRSIESWNGKSWRSCWHCSSPRGVSNGSWMKLFSGGTLW